MAADWMLLEDRQTKRKQHSFVGFVPAKRAANDSQSSSKYSSPQPQAKAEQQPPERLGPASSKLLPLSLSLISAPSSSLEDGPKRSLPFGFSIMNTLDANGSLGASEMEWETTIGRNEQRSVRVPSFCFEKLRRSRERSVSLLDFVQHCWLFVWQN